MTPATRPTAPRTWASSSARCCASTRAAAARTATATACPKSNPFVGKKGAQPEIWAYGLRNPWRWSFDRLTNDLWIGDVGMWTLRGGQPGRGAQRRQGRQLRLAADGRARSATTPPGAATTASSRTPFAVVPPPERHRARSTGGYVYRGKQYPALRSWYVFGDYCSGRIMLLELGRQVRPEAQGRAGHRRPRSAPLARVRTASCTSSTMAPATASTGSPASGADRHPRRPREGTGCIELDAEVRAFLERPRRFATLATIDADGMPRQAVVWYRLEPDGSILVNSARGPSLAQQPAARPACLAAGARTAMTTWPSGAWRSDSTRDRPPRTTSSRSPACTSVARSCRGARPGSEGWRASRSSSGPAP